ncbi:Crp/Fnr family transcriptional regulator [Limobrevibacterium gyesilva]|uniref:Helix-turn-helix domain-containing protein n=1 Tax=Limobrevibacterium gyesilva TaxID=2991712 RepID=A0AA42CGJ5_9PROT|nr:helix-turn-helix domain-containing protein [Limobrevibacterium gyesilva]MCW3477799.1 helix-turn-helix domain-containing protein [Limobrevibacterium gyesilva]
MVAVRARPIVLEPLAAAEPCAHCDARSYSVCNAIEIKDLERLAAMAVSISVEPGRSFIVEGDPAEHFFNVTAGTAKLFKLLPDGRRQITGFAGTGHFLGLAVSSVYAFGAEAVDPMRVCRFSRPKLRAMLDDFPAMETRLLEVASNELVAAQEQMLLLGRKTARERLASFLIARASIPTHCVAQAPGMARTVTLPMTRGDIADYLGLTIETVSRTLTRLKADGLIEIPSNGAIVLRDRAALESVAGGLD